MRTILLLLLSAAIFGRSNGQNVGINTDGSTPNTNAILDIKAGNKGILIPRMDSTARRAIPNTKGLLVYDSSTTSFWFNDGSQWNNLLASGSGWALTGNAGTDTAKDFLGTTDKSSLLFKLNNTKAGELDSAGDNTAFGFKAMMANRSGLQNVAIGNNSLSRNTVGFQMVAIGDSALYSTVVDPSNQYSNVAVGYTSLKANTSGDNNTGVGWGTLASNTTATANTAVGNASLWFNITGSANTGAGCFALEFNTTGGSNSAFGYQALTTNTTGNNNTASGFEAMQLNTTGSYNTASGSGALSVNTSGNQNNAYGRRALQSNTTGYSNTAVGNWALNQNKTGSNLVAVGDSALFNDGVGATQPTDGTANTALGSKALFANTTGSQNTAVGFTALIGNRTGGANTAVGSFALAVDSMGSLNTAMGVNALQHSSGDDNTAIGVNALVTNNAGNQNTGVGSGALFDNTTGSDNTAIGYLAGIIPGNVLNNATAIGANARVAASNSIQFGNTAITDVYFGDGFTAVLHGASITPSDLRLKNSIQPIGLGLAFINLLNPVTYFYNEQKDDHLHSGFLAQDVEKAATTLGSTFSGVYRPTTQSGYYALNYQDFVVPLVKSVQELTQQHATLVDEIGILNRQILEMRERLDRLEARRTKKNAH